MMARDAAGWQKILHLCGVDDIHAAAWAPHCATVLSDDVFDGGDEEMAQFLGQCLHESTMLTETAENLNYNVNGLLLTFGTQRIAVSQALQFGRVDQKTLTTQGGKTGLVVNGVFYPATPKAADQEAIANIVYGGAWGAHNLGNIRDGDGWKYRGSGWIETTGAANFLRAEKKTDIPFSTQPELMRTIGTAPIEAAVAWWHDNITTVMLSDALALRKRVNGPAALGLQDCIVLTSKARAALSSVPSTPKD